MFDSKKISVAIMVSMMMLASSVATAAPQWCQGKLSNLWVSREGTVYVLTSWRKDYVRVCNINNTLGTVTPQVCATWMTFMRNAVTNKENTLIYYPEAPACGSMPVYDGAPAPGYVMLMD